MRLQILESWRGGKSKLLKELSRSRSIWERVCYETDRFVKIRSEWQCTGECYNTEGSRSAGTLLLESGDTGWSFCNTHTNPISRTASQERSIRFVLFSCFYLGWEQVNMLWAFLPKVLAVGFTSEIIVHISSSQLDGQEVTIVQRLCWPGHICVFTTRAGQKLGIIWYRRRGTLITPWYSIVFPPTPRHNWGV